MNRSDGRIPPHDLEAEAAVLADAMIDASGFDEVAELLRPDRFYAEAHAQIWAAMERLRERGSPLDLVTVGGELKRVDRIAQVGGLGYLTDLLNATPAPANKRAHAERIVECWRLRQIGLTCQEAAARVYAGGAHSATLLDATETRLMAIGATGHSVRGERIGPLAARVVSDLIEAQNRGEETTGIPSGLEGYDALTGGFHRGDVTVIAARPGMGKTSFALSCALAIADPARDPPDRPRLATAFFSLEMPREQLAHRLVCMQGSVDVARLRRLKSVTDRDWSKLISATDAVKLHRVDIDDTAALAVTELRAKVRRRRAECARAGEELAVVFIDYLQLMREPGESHREREVSAISQALKALAKEQQVAVVALSQLNRAVESRTEKRPLLSDLRESGAIEQDADNVVFLYRPAYYARLAGDSMSVEDAEVAEVIVAKQRNGPTGTVLVRFEEAYARFTSRGGVFPRGQAAE